MADSLPLGWLTPAASTLDWTSFASTNLSLVLKGEWSADDFSASVANLLAGLAGNAVTQIEKLESETVIAAIIAAGTSLAVSAVEFGILEAAAPEPKSKGVFSVADLSKQKGITAKLGLLTGLALESAGYVKLAQQVFSDCAVGQGGN